MAFTRKELTAAVETRLKAIPNLTVYVGEVPKTPPTLGENDPRVAPYVVLHPGSGVPSPETNQGDEAILLDWTFQVTCVVGRPSDLPLVLDHVTGQLERWQPIGQPGCGTCKQISNLDTPIPDKNQTPLRYFIPLTYRVPRNL